MTHDTNNVGAAGAQGDVLIRWTSWLDDFIGGVSALPGETATDFCCAAADEWQRRVIDDPPAPDSAAMLALAFVLGCARAARIGFVLGRDVRNLEPIKTDERPIGLDRSGFLYLLLGHEVIGRPTAPARTGQFRSIPGHWRRINDD